MSTRDLTEVARGNGWTIPEGWYVFAHTERVFRDLDDDWVREEAAQAYAAGSWCWVRGVVRVEDSIGVTRAVVRGPDEIEGDAPGMCEGADPLAEIGERIWDELDEVCKGAGLECRESARMSAAPPPTERVAYLVDNVREKVGAEGTVLAELITLTRWSERNAGVCAAVAQVGRTVYRMDVSSFCATEHADVLQAREAFTAAVMRPSPELTSQWVQPRVVADPRRVHEVTVG